MSSYIPSYEWRRDQSISNWIKKRWTDLPTPFFLSNCNEIAAYVLIASAAVSPNAVDESDVIVQILQWIGFQIKAIRNHIIANTF